MLKEKKIVIAITGSIAAYKIPLLVRLLVKEKADVRVIMTPAATGFVTPLTLSTLSLHPVTIEPYDPDTGEWNNHVELGRWADLMLFAPVTANTLGKMANGIADNFLVTAYLSAKCPVFIAPAMDLDMYLHPATRKNIEILRQFGNHIIEPQTGELASGLTGPGRMEEPEIILSLLSDHFSRQHDLSKKKILITAGPTYENIDPVRFIGNYSSGLMGFELAEEAASRGGEIDLVTGPSHLMMREPSVTLHPVVSAAEMYQQCTKLFSDTDIIIMAAAVADYTPEKPSPDKIKKTKGNLTLTLKPTPDILKELGKHKKKGQILIGFALETENEVENAHAKLKKKNLDFIVLNSLRDPGAGFGHTTNRVIILDNQGVVLRGELKSKREVARDIINVIMDRL